MVAKVTASQAVTTNNTAARTVNKTYNNDEEVFEINSETECTDTFKSSSSKKSDNSNDGKISKGKFWSEFFSGMWNNVKKQGKELIKTFKEHPILATGAVVTTIAGAACSPIVAGILGGLSVGMGVYGLVKSAINGVKAYNKYKNAKTDDEAKQQAREIGANTLNAVEDTAMIVLGGRPLWKLGQKAAKYIKKLIKPPRFNLVKLRRKVKNSFMDNALLVARVAACNSDDAVRTSSLVASGIEAYNKEQNNPYCETTTKPIKK